LDPASPDFRDSGAILVSAATSGIEEEPQHARLSYAPFGKRVDCYAWGENIVTLTLDPANPTAGYTTNFGGTSGASAIIAGVALVVQGWAEATTGLRLTPSALRSRLSNLALGTPPVSPEPIGSMPNLQLVLQT
jgi:hypothetical protein